MMSDTYQISWIWLAPAFAAGMVLGLFYFRGLWATVKRIHDAHRPAMLIIGSYLLRTAVVMAGFYLIMGGHWERLVSALIGFLIVRQIMVRRFGPLTQSGAK